MRRSRLIPLALFAAFLIACPLGHAQQATPEPYQLVRTLQLLQDQLARGHIDAHDEQTKLLVRIGDEFVKTDPSVWQDPRNARAAALFLLSGGQPRVVRILLDRKALDGGDKLLIGALAYVEGREGEASESLKDFDPRALPPAVGGQIALVQSALLVRQDIKSAMQRLDEARLLVPGTLVDEAALRREIFLAGQSDDFDKFEALAVLYVRRYRDSIYAGNFRQRFALAMTRFSFAQDPKNFSRIAHILDQLDVASRRTLYLLIARTAIVHGRPLMARLAADQAFQLSEEGSAEKERARLYRGAAQVVTDGYEAGLAELTGIAASQLTGRDLELLEAAQSLARHVRKPLPLVSPAVPAGAGGKTESGPKSAAAPKSDGGAKVEAASKAEATPAAPAAVPPAPPRLDVKRSDDALAHARKAMGDVDLLLKEKSR
jgi:chemotaxis protein MotC